MSPTAFALATIGGLIYTLSVPVRCSLADGSDDSSKCYSSNRTSRFDR